MTKGRSVTTFPGDSVLLRKLSFLFMASDIINKLRTFFRVSVGVSWLCKEFSNFIPKLNSSNVGIMTGHKTASTNLGCVINFVVFK